MGLNKIKKLVLLATFTANTAQKMKKSLMENFSFCVVKLGLQQSQSLETMF